MADVFCNQCGHRNPPGSNFCSSCGNVLDVRREEQTVSFHAVDPAQDADDDVTLGLDEVPAGAGLLVVRRGPNAGERYPLTNPVTAAGRHPESDIFLDDITVSRRHAEILRQDPAYVLRDVGSLNGTYLNRSRIEGDVRLSNGDELQIGKFKLVFLAGADALR